MWGVGFGVEGVKVGVEGARFGVCGLTFGFVVWGSGFRIWGEGLRADEHLVEGRLGDRDVDRAPVDVVVRGPGVHDVAVLGAAAGELAGVDVDHVVLDQAPLVARHHLVAQLVIRHVALAALVGDELLRERNLHHRGERVGRGEGRGEVGDVVEGLGGEAFPVLARRRCDICHKRSQGSVTPNARLVANVSLFASTSSNPSSMTTPHHTLHRQASGSPGRGAEKASCSQGLAGNAPSLGESTGLVRRTDSVEAGIVIAWDRIALCERSEANV